MFKSWPKDYETSHVLTFHFVSKKNRRTLDTFELFLHMSTAKTTNILHTFTGFFSQTLPLFFVVVRGIKEAFFVDHELAELVISTNVLRKGVKVHVVSYN